MNENIINSSETLIRSQKRRKLWLRIVIALACIVVFCTTYALILPAMTLGNTAYCGVEEHTHSESCYKTQLICTDENHTHTDNCYKKELICGKDEHTHSKACYSNPDEDKEAAEIWEKTLPESLSQSRRENIVSIAESQLGYSESEKNYSVSDDGALNGYTRYGEWYGDKYGDWSGMFVSFCLKYAGVPESEVPYGSETASWVQALSWKGLYKSAKEYAPQIGDIVFFDTDGNAKADRAGIVSEISGDTVKTIEGDSDNRVERKSYSLGDGTIVGFGFIPEKLSLAAPAPNAVTVKSDAELKNAVNAGGSIMLGADFTMSAVTVPAGKNVTLDLNGHKLTSNGSFTVQGNLTVTDSSASAETVTNEGGNSYGRTASAVKQGDGSVTLTYYVTETRVVNPASGATEEILKKHVVNSKGVINGGGQPVFTVQNGGNLSIEGGMVYGGSNRAVNMSGGNLNLKGGYISGFKKTGAIGTADQNFGGAVIATGGTVNISGAVLAGNDALNGGAIYAKGNAEINVTDGVISGNRSTRNSGNWGDHSEGAPYRCGGGGIFTSGANEITMTGGYITNNTAADDDYFDGGGGVLIGGTTVFTMDGGYITGNEASGGGGVRTDWGKKTFFNMNSGFISGNVARGAEGGGAAITQQGTGNFEGGYITNNVIVKTPHWGGGGLFCSDGSTIYLKSALITENAAGGFGGGVAGCPTGKIYLYIDEGCSIFDNTVNLYPDSPHLSGDGSAKGKDHDVCDDFFRAHGHKDYFCALSSTVTGKMLGGGAANWEGSADGKAVTGGMDDILQAINVMGLTSNPDAAGKKAAQDAAAVYINGNESYTHGGGILCNGDLIVGNPVDIEVPVSLELKATKLLLGGSGDALSLKDNNFTFTVKNEAGETVSSGKCDENGNITFAPKLEFSKDGTYTFYIKESTENKDPEIQYDTTEYRLTVKVKKDGGKPLYGDTTKYTYEIIGIKIEKRNGDEPWQLVSENNNKQSGIITLPITSGTTFVNLKPNSKNLAVKKKWVEGVGAPSVTVDLYRNGVIIDTVILSDANSWSYRWADLPTKDEDGNIYEYEIRERPIPGFIGDYTTASGGSGGETRSCWVPADELIPGEKYIIVNSSGDTALWIAPNNERNAFDGNDKISVSQKTGALTLGGKTYTSWYEAGDIEDRSIFTAEEISKSGNRCIVFKDAGTTQTTYLYAENENQLKGGSSTRFSSAFSLAGELLKVQFSSNWSPDNLRTVTYDGNKFGISTSSQNSARLYRLVTDTVSSGAGDETTIITNTPIKDIDFTLKLTKVSKEDPSKVLEGAVFAILDESGNKLFFTGENGIYALASEETAGAFDEITTGEDGKLTVTGLPAGKYILREVKAPNGFGLAEDIEFVLDESVPSAVFEITVEDPNLGYELPETGGTGTAVFTAAGLLLTAGSLIYGYKRRSERRRREG